VQPPTRDDEAVRDLARARAMMRAKTCNGVGTG
jgi:hypothetical protein